MEQTQGPCRLSEQRYRQLDHASAQPFAERLGLRVLPRRCGDAFLKKTVYHEVERPRSSGNGADRSTCSSFSGRSLRRRSIGQLVVEPCPCLLGPSEDPEVRIAALVARAVSDERAERDRQLVPSCPGSAADPGSSSSTGLPTGATESTCLVSLPKIVDVLGNQVGRNGRRPVDAERLTLALGLPPRPYIPGCRPAPCAPSHRRTLADLALVGVLDGDAPNRSRLLLCRRVGLVGRDRRGCR